MEQQTAVIVRQNFRFSITTTDDTGFKSTISFPIYVSAETKDFLVKLLRASPTVNEIETYLITKGGVA